VTGSFSVFDETHSLAATIGTVTQARTATIGNDTQSLTATTINVAQSTPATTGSPEMIAEDTAAMELLLKRHLLTPQVIKTVLTIFHPIICFQLLTVLPFIYRWLQMLLPATRKILEEDRQAEAIASFLICLIAISLSISNTPLLEAVHFP
jgi:hypothetical protein